MRALVVEDNLPNMKLITLVLKRHGYEVTPKVSGEEAVEIMSRKTYPKIDLILLDIMLPGIDGAEVARQIRKKRVFKNIPIVAITSFAMMGDRDKALAAGCNGYIEKPIDSLTVMDEIEKAAKAA